MTRTAVAEGGAQSGPLASSLLHPTPHFKAANLDPAGAALSSDGSVTTRVN